MKALSRTEDRLADTEQAARLSDLINSSWMTRAIHAGIELGVFDALIAEPRTTDRLARDLGCSADSLRRLLVALVALDVCEPVGEGFGLAAMGRLLAASTPGSLRDWARFWCEDLEPLWSGLGDSIRAGRSVRDLRGLGGGFGRLDGDAQRANVFNAAMASNSYWVARAFSECEELKDVERLVDVGGGRGALLAALLHAHPDMHGIAFDLPHAASEATAFLESEGLGHRGRFVSGDFFASVPPGAAAYVLKSVLHDWGDDECRAILRRCRQAIAPGGRLFVIERLLDGGRADPLSDRACARSDLNMMVSLGARERDSRGYRALLGAEGFEIDRFIPLAMGLTAIKSTLIGAKKGAA